MLEEACEELEGGVCLKFYGALLRMMMRVSPGPGGAEVCNRHLG